MSAGPAGGTGTGAVGCACGYQALTGKELTDHLAEMFTPGDDIAGDGRRHAEMSRAAGDGTGWECLCGAAAASAEALDAHLLAAFTPADRVGLDGQVHL
jgi:hypothetical protein